MKMPSVVRAGVALLTSASALFVAACGGRNVIVSELVSGEERARPAESVEMYRNAPPRRPFTARYVIDLSVPIPPEPEAIVRYRDVGGKLGCDAVVIYTAEHPALKTAPASDDQALVLGMDGVLAWRAIGSTSSNRRAFHVEGPTKTHVTDAATVGLCLAFTSKT